MKFGRLNSFDDDDNELYVAVLKDAKRDYRAALKHIQSRETFLARHLEGLGYDSENLYAAETFSYPADEVKYNGGLNWIHSKEYMLFFAKDDTGWHFNVAPTARMPEGGTLIMDERARRLLDSPAGMVLRCAARIDRDIVSILDQVASVVSTWAPMRKAGKKPARRAGAKTGGPPPKEDLH
ncbi:hypothetical protein [Polyangium mundeleinium]|uniref:Uncharacterized protein n=1 Tax=Polyangium mundeleinium TaxID=2995306 RepID=A0ABT5F776_9BACT|nr:hypothetical protein [Polyangium mundeleinium]MDC0749957.1 hypothetical protein [Polyangium mundeleinium]